MKVSAIMKTDVVTVNAADSVEQLDPMVLGAGFSGFPVLRDGKVVGCCSKTDVIRAVYDREDAVTDILSGLRVQDVMNPYVISASPDADMAEIAQLMLKNRVHRVMVVDNGKLVGIVTTLDLARAYVALAEESGHASLSSGGATPDVATDRSRRGSSPS